MKTGDNTLMYSQSFVQYGTHWNRSCICTLGLHRICSEFELVNEKDRAPGEGFLVCSGPLSSVKWQFLASRVRGTSMARGKASRAWYFSVC